MAQSRSLPPNSSTQHPRLPWTPWPALCRAGSDAVDPPSETQSQALGWSCSPVPLGVELGPLGWGADLGPRWCLRSRRSLSWGALCSWLCDPGVFSRGRVPGGVGAC